MENAVNYTFSILINVQIPALEAYVNYVQSKDDTQTKINALTTQVQALTVQLAESTGHLEDAVEAQQG